MNPEPRSRSRSSRPGPLRAALIAAVVALATLIGVPMTAQADGEEWIDDLQDAGLVESVDDEWVTLTNGMAVSLVPMALGDCPNGSLCFWADASFTGTLVTFSGGGNSWSDLSIFGFNDKMSSWANRTAYDARWYYDISFGGTSRCMQPGTTLSYVGATDNDKASSVRIYTNSTTC